MDNVYLDDKSQMETYPIDILEDILEFLNETPFECKCGAIWESIERKRTKQGLINRITSEFTMDE